VLNLLKVAVTGGVASGKTTVCQIFSSLGAFVASADKIVHEILEKEGRLPPDVVKAFSRGAPPDKPFRQEDLIVDNKMDRAKLAQIVFQDPFKRRALENWLHPLVIEELKRRFAEAEQQKRKLVVAEIPLLYETGFEIEFNKVIAVYAPFNTRLKRTALDPHMFLLRNDAQMSPEKKIAISDYVIENEGSFDELHEKVKHLYLHLTKEK
jgi:dephospho-CoA kinase